MFLELIFVTIFYKKFTSKYKLKKKNDITFKNMFLVYVDVKKQMRDREKKVAKSHCFRLTDSEMK